MLKQSLQQKLLQKLSPQQIQLMKLLQVPTVELEQRIKEEMEENPALEEGRDEEENEEEDVREETEVDDSRDDFDINDYLDDDLPAYKTSVNNKGKDEEDTSIPLSVGATFRENLQTQLGLRDFNEEDEKLAMTIIGNLDDDGYLRRELAAIVNDLAFSQNIMTTKEHLKTLLLTIQEFDPAGVGARGLQECLLLQLYRKEKDYDIALAIKVLEECFDEFTKKHYTKILNKFEIDEEGLKDAIEVILKLNPKPGSSGTSNTRTAQTIVPDFIMTSDEDELQLTLNQRNAPELRISRNYRSMLRTYSEGKKTSEDKKAIMFIRQKVDSAKWFIDAIVQRQQTLLFTMNTIMEYQRAYFMTGDETKLKPMILKDIAEIVQMDISTVSRVANSKYVLTPYGTFLLKYFFSESLTNDSGEEVSTREVKKILQDSIDDEDKKKPMTDEKLASVLKEKGYNIARRTVAKYREQLHIPVARMRKEI